MLSKTSSKYPRSLFVLHCTRPLIRFVELLKPPGFVFLLPSQFHQFVPFFFSRWQSNIAGTSPGQSICETVFELLLVEKCLCVSRRVLYRSLLPASERRCWMSLSLTLSALLIEHFSGAPTSLTSLLRFFPSDLISSFHFEPPYFEVWTVYWGEDDLDSCITFTQPGPLDPITHWLWSKIRHLPPMQRELPADRNTASALAIKAFHAGLSRWIYKAIENCEKVGTPSGERNSPVSLTLFYQVSIALRDRLSPMQNLQFVLGGLWAAIRKQSSIDELLRTIAGFVHLTQNELTNSYQEAVAKSKIRRPTANVRRFWVRLEAHWTIKSGLQRYCRWKLLSEKWMAPTCFQRRLWTRHQEGRLWLLRLANLAKTSVWK